MGELLTKGRGRDNGKIDGGKWRKEREKQRDETNEEGAQEREEEVARKRELGEGKEKREKR